MTPFEKYALGFAMWSCMWFWIEKIADALRGGPR